MTAQTPLPPADPTAVMGRRILAYVIDGVILLVLMIALFANMASSLDLGSSQAAEELCNAFDIDNDADVACLVADTGVILIDFADLAILALIAGIYVIVTQLLLPSITGFSPGKAMVGLRIVNQDSFQRAGLGANLLRWLLWVVDSAPWCFPLVGLITGLSSKGHRRVGDMAAKTLVIDRKWVGQPLAVPGVNSLLPTTSPAPVSAPTFPSSTPPPPPTVTGPPLSPPVQAPPTQPPPPSQPPPPTQSLPTQPPPPSQPPPPMTPPATTPVFDTPAPIAPPASPPAPEPPAAEPPPPEPPAPAPEDNTPIRPGVDAPQWDDDRDTYIQWDPELEAWMEWSESRGAWIPISQ